MNNRRQLQGTVAIGAALDRGEALRRVVVCRDPGQELSALLGRVRSAGVPVQQVSPRSFERLRECREAGDILALVGPSPDSSPEDVLADDGVTWQLVDVGYPGNAGVAVRTAEVSGASGVFIDGAFDRAERRAVLRASMRADRFMPVFFAPASAVIAAVARSGRPLVAIEATGEVAPWEVDLSGPVHLVVGGEASGIPDEILAACSTVIRIPMSGFVPSYNLQVAVAAVAAERLRQLEGASS